MKQLPAIMLLVCAVSVANAQAKWHHPLYLGGDGYWHQRIEVQVSNQEQKEAMGVPVALRIGTAPGEADLQGAQAEEVRVCDSQGTEMLFDIATPDGRPVTNGPIPAGGTITIPAECPPEGTATYYVYFDNPSAWEVPDFLDASAGVRNGGMEVGSGVAPTGWQHDAGDARHRALWVSESPHSGKKCLKTVVAEGAEPTWIATRQRGIHITGGAKYIMRAWVKAENVKGYAGWYIHVGNRDNYMIISPMLSGGGGTYDWKEVTAEFTAPVEADQADLGTVLRGTGVAWFDDVTLECKAPALLTATAAKPERMKLQEVGAAGEWFDEDPNDDIHWDWRLPVKVFNFSDATSRDVLAQVDLAPFNGRLRGRLNLDGVRVVAQGRQVPHYLLGETLVFEVHLPPRSLHTYWVYLSDDERIGPGKQSGYEVILHSRRNLVRNPSFEEGDKTPADWDGDSEGIKPKGTQMGLAEPGLFGKRCVKTYVPHGALKAWTGWRQDVPVEPGKTYLYAAWVRTKDIQDGDVRLHAHCRNAAGELAKTAPYVSAGSSITGTHDWTLMSGTFTMPPDTSIFQLHLTMLATGTVWHDGVVLAEAANAAAGPLQTREDTDISGLAAWPVNAVVKVFQEDVPPSRIPPARISAARNEKEPLQLAVRSARAARGVTVQVQPPVNDRGERLDDIQVDVVGYVPIDYPTNYYHSQAPAWHRKHPTASPSCDGWQGMWPDPLLPRSTFDLAANKTQPVWITISVPKDAAAGDYSGKVRLVAGRRILKEVPFTVHVWDFTLPDERHIAAIYDVRVGDRWRTPGGSLEQTREQLVRLMADHRLCPDTIHPDPVIRYENGTVHADFTEFDKAAEVYFNRLHMPHTYTPWYFYCFGWGNPPGTKFGEKPYEGEYPYNGVDRGKLRPQFKKAYQACLRAYWEHMKQKGWADKVVLYISDEPFFQMPEIRKQMKALCDMVHEVDPAIPIYCSTWFHWPEWDGYLNVWGIGHYGTVPPDKMAKLRQAGARLWFTTDGQMCTDTPYCAVERLLPHYCFKYGVEAYEFWGISWLTYDPYKFGWHAYIRQSSTPGETSWVRYPNGDGFLAYPGGPIGHDGPVSSIRLEQAREGVEDYEYLYLLRELAAKAKAAGKDSRAATEALERANRLVSIPNAGGRFSTKILPDPDAVLRVKRIVARAIERLKNQLGGASKEP